MKKPMIILIPSLFLFGCSYQPPILNENQYNQYAALMLMLDKCYYAGYIDTENTALGKTYLNSTISKFTYDKNALDIKYNEFKNKYENINIPQSEEIANCKNIELNIVQTKQKNNRMENQREIINNYHNRTPKTTYCNQIGSQTFCNSY